MEQALSQYEKMMQAPHQLDDDELDQAFKKFDIPFEMRMEILARRAKFVIKDPLHAKTFAALARFQFDEVDRLIKLKEKMNERNIKVV
ncbi:hypothetical protein [Acidihalobacter prosperus]|uniref:Uncharacterized protein n=1 Tax=Acidihalobacter prosperus TaxID=160660 RepID=A0A1A6C323_9GAMM|nr:hypothetical protein [Acidihalobacter prosperus]OBS08956.1 hypothetical protein Thpro_022073 [Acidihalobacter prosperus]